MKKVASLLSITIFVSILLAGLMGGCAKDNTATIM